jgi:hypothetical protein
MNVRRSLAFVFVIGISLWTAATATAAQTYNDRISGYEYAFTSTEGRFAGSASGALPGLWETDVRHTPLCLSCTPTATITGGSFSLATGSGVVSGTFTGGTVQVINPGANCTNQTFAVKGPLGAVGRGSGGSGTGLFSATLTHFRHRIFGSCVSYAASVNGLLSLTF